MFNLFNNDCNCGCGGYCNSCGGSGNSGTRGPCGPTGATGPQGPAGPQGAVGRQGMRGEKGQAGATILNSYETYNQFITEHPTGTGGDAYLVDGELYVWDAVNKVWKKMGSLVGPQGEAGQPGEKGKDGVSPKVSVIGTVTGEPGTDASVVETFSETGVDLLFTIPRGDAGTGGIIPFCVSKQGSSFTIDENGQPSEIYFSGFSADTGVATYLDPNEWVSGSITVSGTKHFGATFIVPYTGKLKKIFLRVSPGYTELSLPSGSTLRPFVCLAFADPDKMIFKIQKETMTFCEPFLGGVPYTNTSSKSGALLDLNLDIKEGTLVAIIAGIMGEKLEDYFSVTLAMGGSLYLQ